MSTSYNSYCSNQYSELLRLTQQKTAESRRRKIIEQLGKLGAPIPSHEVGGVVASFRNVFDKPGVVIVGSCAFDIYTCELGCVHVDPRIVSTNDVDIACSHALVGVSPPVLSDANSPSRMFAGGRCSIDFIVAAKEVTNQQTLEFVWVNHLNTYAYQLPGIDLLLTEPRMAVIPTSSGICAKVPDPIRYAFHKLWLSQRRCDGDKAEKDCFQAALLLDFLVPRNMDRASRLLDAFVQYGNGFFREGIREGLTRCSDEGNGAFAKWRQQSLAVLSR